MRKLKDFLIAKDIRDRQGGILFFSIQVALRHVQTLLYFWVRLLSVFGY